jgi:hypothetical protein
MSWMPVDEVDVQDAACQLPDVPTAAQKYSKYTVPIDLETISLRHAHDRPPSYSIKHSSIRTHIMHTQAASKVIMLHIRHRHRHPTDSSTSELLRRVLRLTTEHEAGESRHGGPALGCGWAYRVEALRALACLSATTHTHLAHG